MIFSKMVSVTYCILLCIFRVNNHRSSVKSIGAVLSKEVALFKEVKLKPHFFLCIYVKLRVPSSINRKTYLLSRIGQMYRLIMLTSRIRCCTMVRFRHWIPYRAPAPTSAKLLQMYCSFIKFWLWFSN